MPLNNGSLFFFFDGFLFFFPYFFFEHNLFSNYQMFEWVFVRSKTIQFENMYVWVCLCVFFSFNWNCTRQKQNFVRMFNWLMSIIDLNNIRQFLKDECRTKNLIIDYKIIALNFVKFFSSLSISYTHYINSFSASQNFFDYAEVHSLCRRNPTIYIKKIIRKYILGLNCL